jgi:glycosyltransferase involved in cell wall biosynthesis
VRRRLLFFGLVRPYKGLDVLIEALVTAPPDVSVLVAGEFWIPINELRAQAEELGVAARLDMRSGYVPADQVAPLFAAVDALVLPYRSGTATQNVELAFDHGIPVVVSGVGSMAKAVRDGVDGLVVPPDDPKALSDALHRLYEPGVLERLRAGVPLVSAAPIWQAYVAALRDLAAADAADAADAGDAGDAGEVTWA